MVERELPAPAQRVFVCGGGHQGLSMAAHLALNGVQVTMWNRTARNIQSVIDTHQIRCSGVINGTAVVEDASQDMEQVISDFVMVATPSSAHKDIAMRLAPYAHKDMVIVLNPGRTFGALEFAETLRQCGVQDMPHIAETQTIVYTCRRGEQNSTVIHALKDDVKIAAIDNDTDYIMSRMPKCLVSHFTPVESVFITSLSNVGMVLHCAPILMNIGWIETEKVDFKYYYDGISPTVARFIEKIDDERLAVARELGYEVESTADWMRRTYHVTGADLHECIRNNSAYQEIDAPHSIQCRYILEDVPCGLIPVEDAGRKLGVPTPNITVLVDMINAVFDCDFRQKGRKLPENFKLR